MGGGGGGGERGSIRHCHQQGLRVGSPSSATAHGAGSGPTLFRSPPSLPGHSTYSPHPHFYCSRYSPASPHQHFYLFPLQPCQPTPTLLPVPVTVLPAHTNTSTCSRYSPASPHPHFYLFPLQSCQPTPTLLPVPVTALPAHTHTTSTRFQEGMWKATYPHTHSGSTSARVGGGVAYTNTTTCSQGGLAGVGGGGGAWGGGGGGWCHTGTHPHHLYCSRREKRVVVVSRTHLHIHLLPWGGGGGVNWRGRKTERHKECTT